MAFYQTPGADYCDFKSSLYHLDAHPNSPLDDNFMSRVMKIPKTSYNN